MLVLIAHGSRDDRWRGALSELTEKVQDGSPEEEVRLAFMQFGGPSLESILSEGVGRGVETFRLLPLFMASAGHVDKDIKPLVRELAEDFPDVDIHLLGPVGEHTLFPSLLLNIANETLS
jgi:sirohydrochlorin cobaltochelatase